MDVFMYKGVSDLVKIFKVLFVILYTLREYSDVLN